MPFANIEVRETSKIKYAEYLSLTPGTHTIRILEQAHPIDMHYLMGKYNVACTGDDCPVCANNRKIWLENPNDFRKIPGYSPKSVRYVANVLDKTKVKICPNCKTENKKSGTTFAPTCMKCNTFITTEAEVVSNKVKLLTCGVTLSNQLNQIELSFVDEGGNPVPITSYDINLAVVGTSKEKLVTPIALTHASGPVSIPEEAMNDYKQAVITLSADEILSLLRGTALRDIFLARGKKEKSTVGNSAPAPDAETASSEDKLLEELFGK